MQRRIEPEWLDTLPPDDPRAVRSRRDLRRVNAWMRNAAIVARALRKSPQSPMRRVVELGAGDGAFLLSLARQIARRGGPVEATLVDRQRLLPAQTARQFEALGWRAEAVQADVFDWLARSGDRPVDLVVANLFLHHFCDTEIEALLARAGHLTNIFVACEPRRSVAALAATRLLGLIGCNDVTRHDARISVRAGFCGRELSALWPSANGWHLREEPAGLFSHCFFAARGGDPV
ncbi:MAG: methyltransferase domain-containing protein [Limisphaerales bacterium]